MKLSASLAALALGLTSACTTAPIAALPEPLPESLPWSVATEPGGAFLGLHVEENDTGSLDDLFFQPGVRVSRVIESSPARGAGVAAGDVVLSVDGEEVNDPEAFDALIAEREAGARVELRVQRGDTVHAVEVATEGRRGDEAARVRALYHQDPARSRAGWATADGGVQLVSLAPDSPLAERDIALGSKVTAVDEEAVHSARELIRTLQTYEAGATVRLAYSTPEGEARVRKVTLAEPPKRITNFSIPVLYTYRSDVAGEETGWVLLDLYFISLFRYARTGSEREYRFLRFFKYSTGVGELAS